MKFLLDENVEYRLVSFLQNLGHNVTAIGYDYPHSLSDSEVLELAQKEQRILLTNDHSDFGTHFPPAPPPLGHYYFPSQNWR